jgi:hypothetical protein
MSRISVKNIMFKNISGNSFAFYLLFSGVLLKKIVRKSHYIQSASGGKVSILGGRSIGHSTQKSVYVHVSYSERSPR